MLEWYLSLTAFFMLILGIVWSRSTLLNVLIKVGCWVGFISGVYLMYKYGVLPPLIPTQTGIPPTVQ